MTIENKPTQQIDMFNTQDYNEKREKLRVQSLPYTPYFLEDVYKSEQRQLFNVISTFAGGGGSSTGYRLAGGHVLLVNEFVDAAIDTYKANYPNTIIMPHDIRILNGEFILKQVGLKVGELDILDGSPPCASFSVAGKREKHWNEAKKYSDRKQRTDDLFYEFARIIYEIQPKVFIGENVKGLTIGIAAKVLDNPQYKLTDNEEKENETIISTLIDIGYKVKYKVLNAADFRVPQSRQRLIIIGVRNDLAPEPSHPIPRGSGKISLEEAFKGIQQDEVQREWLIKAEAPTENGKMMARIPKNPDKCISASDYHPKGSYFSLVRSCKHLPAPTITQAGGGIGFSGAFHFAEDRKFTIPELRRIFSLPDDFKLTGTYEQQYERCGRMVPPLLMKAVAEHVYKEILCKL